MKIAITAQGKDLKAPVDFRFGRCPYFVIVDTDSMEFEAYENPAMMAPGGAGIQAAQFVASLGVTHVLTGEVGPNAYPALMAAGIQVITGIQGTVEEVVKAFKEGRLASGMPLESISQENLNTLRERLERMKQELENLIERIKHLEEKK
ncbi:MAG TPA: dinitrogenase iron-molybdenum cofactor biosynthesis protein [candidate division WOR-3 bacterium]|uniref:Dinitrogenase iron-molybdenum cofactor biosynthesis protein n=1 Tax=candidate division WOR-3 bacterium TaxID=2052148 RepID=A0A7C5MDU7_UNCW3|nr:dinitrogenase iron-molybdenum cofactor biosynthesis protein [Candidatus Hydrothermae bacterium]RKY98289.1 MAG: dinitrogenase iron-molybdenum cofactor biosynthesis protein [Candidatus Hydrothermae bacterium]HHF58340.1 dinitrogenase iron-molybdenum cofactor biosynthesis protein [candidate division WOR-3 bacterium]